MHITTTEPRAARTAARRGSRFLAATTIAALTLGAALVSAPAANAAAVGTIEGTISTRAESLSNATVVLYDSATDDFVAQVEVDPSGHYEFADVASGGYTIQGHAFYDLQDNVQRQAFAYYADSDYNPIVVHPDGSGPFDFAVDFALGAVTTPTVKDGPYLEGPITVTPGTWDEPGVTNTYKWRANFEDIPGATGDTLEITNALLGSNITAVQIGSKPGFATTEQYVDFYADGLGTVTSGGADVTSSNPDGLSVGDTATVSTYSVEESVWDPQATLSYQWYSTTPGSEEEPTLIAGATSASFAVTDAQLGKVVYAVITARRTNYVAAEQYSQWSEVVTGPTLQAANPVITGTLKVGSRLTATAGKWNTTGVVNTYRWSVYGTPISGATSATYVIPAKYAGNQLTVTVTGKKPGFTSVSKSTTTKAVPFLKFTKTATPTISGTAKVGNTLKAKAGTWSPSGVTFFYTWRANGKDFAYTEKGSVKLPKTVKGKKITVLVYGYKQGYQGVTKTSKSTAKVK